jgi:hypothetical protein
MIIKEDVSSFLMRCKLSDMTQSISCIKLRTFHFLSQYHAKTAYIVSGGKVAFILNLGTDHLHTQATLFQWLTLDMRLDRSQGRSIRGG